MFSIKVRHPWDVVESLHTPETVYHSRQQYRREFLKLIGYSTLGAALTGPLVGCSRPTQDQTGIAEAVGVTPEEQAVQAGEVKPLPEDQARLYPARRNQAFTYGRPETLRFDAARYTNFFEFSRGKETYRFVGLFEPTPWSLTIDGLCSNPRTLDMDDIYTEFALEERAYRHRCVEAWAMCVPWTGFRLRDLLETVEPQASARFVTFETFNRPQQAPTMQDWTYPWPYTEGLTMDEATNELAFVATGNYGEPLLKQHGAPIRLVVPWKYGFKSIKSVVRITLTDKRPATFWNTQLPREYAFEGNVEPDVPHPRWSQKTEWMLGTMERHDSRKYNGYGEFVADLYPS